jgi:hypothetical protein
LRAPARVEVEHFGVAQLRPLVGEQARDARGTLDRAVAEALAHGLGHRLKLLRAHRLAVEVFPHLYHQLALRPRLPLLLRHHG